MFGRVGHMECMPAPTRRSRFAQEHRLEVGVGASWCKQLKLAVVVESADARVRSPGASRRRISHV